MVNEKHVKLRWAIEAWHRTRGQDLRWRRSKQWNKPAIRLGLTRILTASEASTLLPAIIPPRAVHLVIGGIGVSWIPHVYKVRSADLFLGEFWSVHKYSLRLYNRATFLIRSQTANLHTNKVRSKQILESTVSSLS